MMPALRSMVLFSVLIFLLGHVEVVQVSADLSIASIFPADKFDKLDNGLF